MCPSWGRGNGAAYRIRTCDPLITNEGDTVEVTDIARRRISGRGRKAQ
jgi:hypothetical protein